MVTKEGLARFSGHIVKKDGLYYFRSKKGHVFDVVVDDRVKRLADTRELCIYEEIKNNDPKYKFGRVVKVIGRGGDPIPEGRAIAETYNLIPQMSVDVKKEIQNVKTYVSSKDAENFADLRDIPFVTIDPDSAKDYDDAVFAKKNPDGSYELKVAIANVSQYVHLNSHLFNYAMENGNSKYLGDMVYPMLPEELSNGICSLNEGVNRLTICTTCTIMPDGSIKNYKIEPAVIQSRHRLTYKEADFIYFGENAEGDTADHKGLIAKTMDVRDSLNNLMDVASILFDARMQRGAFDIDSREFEFYFNDIRTEVLDFKKAHNEVFTGVIEETAVITNEIWGEVARNLDVPFNYRNHELIDDDDIIKELEVKLKQFNINLPRNFTGKNLQKIVNNVKGKRIQEYVIKTILSSMKPATYSSENYGHVGLGVDSEKNPPKDNINTDYMIDKARSKYFKESGSIYGLAFEVDNGEDISHSAYGHTTSPIRRASDLVNQKQFMSIIMNGKIKFRNEQIEDLSEGFNFNERNSKMAEKEYDDMLFALWAMQKIGMVLENCVIEDMGQYEVFLTSKEGIKLKMPYTALDFPKKYLRIGKELKSVIISDVSLYPPKITVKPNLNMQLNHKELEDDVNVNN